MTIGKPPFFLVIKKCNLEFFRIYYSKLEFRMIYYYYYWNKKNISLIWRIKLKTIKTLTNG